MDVSTILGMAMRTERIEQGILMLSVLLFMNLLISILNFLKK